MRINVYPDREGKGMVAFSSENQKDRERLQAFIDGHPPQRRFIVEMIAGKVDYNREIQIALEFIQVLPAVEPSKEPEKRVSVEDLPGKIKFLKKSIVDLPKLFADAANAAERFQAVVKEFQEVLGKSLIKKVNMSIKE